MNEKDFESQVVSEDTSSEEKLVRVAEAIRYRKRAQAAEQELAEVQQQAKLLQDQKKKLQKQLQQTETDQQIREYLAAAGTVDLETAELILKNRLGGKEGADIAGEVETLRKDKTYLFISKSSGSIDKTAGVRKRVDSSDELEDAAKKAAASGSSRDVLAYLRVKRQYV